MKKQIVSVLIIYSLALSCATRYRPAAVEWVDYSVAADSGKGTKDADLAKMMHYYSDSVHKEMNEVVGTLNVSLSKQDKNNNLNEFVAAGLLFGAKTVFPKVDIALINKGGVRLPSLDPGPITKSKVFELMPFDNTLQCLSITGKELWQIIESSSYKSGEWSIAGLSKNNAIPGPGYLINKEFVNSDSIYYLAISDYLVDVSHEEFGFKKMPLQNSGYLQRDALLAYMQSFTQKGQPITWY